MDLYIVLGLQHGASESEIKRAYRRLARRFHPDINPGDHEAEARFRQILAAYETLVDPERRSQYDAGAPPEPARPRASSGFDGFDFSTRGADHSATFGDLFAEVLSERGDTAPPPARGADLHQEIELPFEDAMRGQRHTLPVTRRETCSVCAGIGVAHGSRGVCELCQGTGATRSARGHMVFSRRCQACHGTGQRRPRACLSCGGAGFGTRTESVHVRIPPGISDGEHVRVAGKGHAGAHGGPPGDLFVRVRVAPHPQFRRDGDDIHLVVPVAVHEAALGARVEVPTLDGPIKLRVPPGTQSGQCFRLRGRGAPSTRDGARGDMLVEVRIVLPGILDERSKELLREFGRINGDSVRAQPRG